MKKDSKTIRKEIEDRLYNYNIVIVGYEKQAADFIEKNCAKTHIKCCVSFDDNHPDSICVNSKEYIVISWSDYICEAGDYLITTGLTRHIDFRLGSEGLNRYIDYIECSVADIILSGKKIAIVSGNCQIVTLHDFLSQIPEFTEKYALCRFSTHAWKSKYSLESLSVLRHFCDTYICLKHEENDGMFFKKSELPKECRIVTLASYLSPIYWPQVKMNRVNSYNEMFVADPQIKGHGSFEFGDANINRMIVENKSVDEIISELSSDNYYSEETVKKHIKRILRMMEFEEAGCDVKMSDYIRENYQKQFLFRDFSHMQVELIWEYTRRVLRCFGIEESSANRIEEERESKLCESFRTHCSEIPVYPSVAKALGLEWYRNRKYDVLFSDGIERLTFEEYIRRYYDICKASYILKTLW